MAWVQLVEECISRLNLPKLICQRSRMVLQEWIQLELTANGEVSWKEKDNALLTVCAIYTALIEYRTEMESPSEQGPRFTLLQILRAGNVNLKKFLQFMNDIGEKYQHSSTMKNCLLGTQRKYVITIGIYKTFDRLMEHIFESSGQKDPSESTYRRRVCWCLFLVAKVTVLPENTELIPALHLMLCCLEYIVKQSPLFMLKEPFRTANSEERLRQDSLSVLTAINTAFTSDSDMKELESAQTNHFHPFIQGLPVEVLNQTADGLPRLKYFERKYRAEYELTADIDEMAFLDDDPLLKPMEEGSPSPDSTINTETGPSIPQTPVRNSVRAVQSLKTLLASANDRPSDSLRLLLSEYGANLVNEVTNRIEELQNTFLEHYALNVRASQTIAKTRYRLGVRLYYRELDQIIKRERERKVQRASIVSLLSEDIFHRCILACSLEVVKVYYEYNASPTQESSIGRGGLDFPWILTIFNVHPYDFCRVIETFIREEAQLSEQAIKHLTSVEEFILESEAWKEGSPLLEALRAKIANTQQVNSPGCSVVGSSGGGQHKDVFLTKFLMKAQQLGFKRLERLSQPLKLSGDITHRIWTCVDHCIRQRPDLLEGRHLDQIIMCCIYAICRVGSAQNQRRLKEIANLYEKMPHADSSTYKQVRLGAGETGHIIKFYNDVFVPAMKTFILSQHSENHPNSPVPHRSPSQQKSYKVHPNFTVSPLRHSPFKSPDSQRQPGSSAAVTPRTALLLNTDEEFISNKLQNFNKTYGTSSKRKNDSQEPVKSRKKLNMGDGGSTTEGSREQSSNTDVENQSEARSILRTKLPRSPSSKSA
ncbi:retinoblastoma-associated protein-like isoform X2 [Apostichopus japonicus]|uniref:retinoblastoma-associated protein-like isoform X2 n=1 Tax=Stichopus japonicus TaxID=307972 RepID=UPI003AB8464F